MKKKIISGLGLALITILLMSNSGGLANRNGAPSETACNASGCHTSFLLNTGGGTVTISNNIPVTGYVPGTTYSFSVTVSRTGSPLFGFGFEAVAANLTTAGNIIVTNSSQTQIMNGIRQNIVHKTNGGLTANSKTFTFNWTAPSTNVGNITFYAAGNAANNNGNDTGDYIYTTNSVVGCAPLTTGVIVGSPFCAGTNSISIPFAAAGGTFLPGNIFTAELSDAAGSFTAPLALGTLSSTSSGTIVSTVPLPGISGTGYRIRITASNPVMIGPDNNVNLIISTAPTISNAGPNQAVCSNSAILSANSPLSGSGSWALQSGAGSVVTSSNPSSAVTGLGLGANVFRWTISNAGCSSSVSDVTITSSNPPSTAIAGSNQTVCLSFANLAATSPASGTGNWSLISGTGSITSTSNPSTSITNLGAGQNIFQWSVSNPGCSSNTATVSLTYAGSISLSNAGPDQTVCANSATLSANTPTAGVGTWTLMSGSAIITSTNNPTSTVSGLGNGVNVFRWIIANSPCTSTFDDVTINSVTVSPASAGSNQTLCATATTLAASVPLNGSGLWTVTSGSASISNPSLAATNVTGLSPGQNSFVWTISNAPCVSSSGTLVITQSGSITLANAGPDQSICSATTTLAGNAAAIGTGSWSVISGAAVVTNPLSPLSTVTGLNINSNVLRWTISNPPCANTIDDITINRSIITTANAGPNMNICSNTVTLGGSVPVFGVGTWSLISGFGTISAPTSPNSTVNNLANGVSVFRWTITNPPCQSSVSDVTITNCTGGPITTASISGSPFCSSSSYAVLVSFSTTGMFGGFYTAELSDALGSFTSNPVSIGSGPTSPIFANIPSGLPSGYAYRIRVKNSNPATIGTNNGSDLLINTCNLNYITIDSIKGSPFCDSTSFHVNVGFKITGTVPGAYVVELSDVSGSFAVPLTIGYAYSSPVAAVIPKGTLPGINYKMRIRSSTTSIVSEPNNSSLAIKSCVTGIDMYSKLDGIKLYPNPNDGLLNIEVSDHYKHISVEVESTLGTLLFSQNYSEVAGTRLKIDLSNLDANIYFLKIKTEEKDAVYKIIKK